MRAQKWECCYFKGFGKELKPGEMVLRDLPYSLTMEGIALCSWHTAEMHPSGVPWRSEELSGDGVCHGRYIRYILGI